MLQQPIRSRWTSGSSGAPRLTPAIGKATMSRLQNKVVGTPMTQRERKAWNAAKDRRELIGQGSAHAEEHDRVGQSVPVHEGQYRPVQLLDLERRETMLGMPQGEGTRGPILKEGFNAEVPRKSRCRHGRQ